MSRSDRKLSILHINTTDSQGGAATSTRRLVDAQTANGHDSKRLVGYKKTPSPTSYHFPVEADPALQAQCVRQGLQYYQFQGSHKLTHHPLVENADILHFQNLHGDYFNPFSISVLSQMKPTVWTLRDMHAITGHCGYSLDCEKWKTGCGDCPYLNNYPELLTDATAQLWQDKKLIYSHSNLHIVTPSLWLKKLVETSILQEHTVDLIYNGTDTGVFRPYPKSEVRKKFNIPDHVPVIGAVAQGSALGNPYKGGQYTLEALKRLRSLVPDFVFVNVGADFPSPDRQIINFPYINNQEELAQIYSALDFFLFTTLADNCPLVVIEAMACGVPLATFDTGGVPELVRDGLDGLVTPYQDIDAIVSSAQRLATDHEFRQQCGQNARQRALENYDMQTVAANYDVLYRRRIETFAAQQASGICLFPIEKVPTVIQTPAFRAAEEFKQQLQTDRQAKTLSSISSQVPESTDQSNASENQPLRLSFRHSTTSPSQRQPEILVSAIISTYNSEQFIRGCLEDLLKQTIADQIEIIVVDSGSSQNEGKIVAEFQQSHPNIKYIRTEQRESIYAAWNRGIQAARGKYITNANTDDRRRIDALEILSGALEAHPEVVLAYADQLYTSVANETYDTTSSNVRRVWSEYSYRTLRSHCMVGPQPMWRRSLHDRYGLFDDSFHSAGDWEFWLRIGEHEQFQKVDQVLGLYYVNPRGLENVHPATLAEDTRIRQKYNIRPEERREPSFSMYERKKIENHTARKEKTRLLLFIQVNGLRRQDVEKHPFFQKFTQNHSALAFSPTLNRVSRPSIFGGLSAESFGFTSQLYFDPVNSPFGIAAALPPTGKNPSVFFEEKERHFFQDFITGERITPYASAILSEYNIPVEYLPFFDIAEKRSPWDKDPGYRSIFHELKQRSIPWYRFSFPEAHRNKISDAGILQHVLNNIPAQTRFAFIQLNDIDAIGQSSGPDSQRHIEAIQNTGQLLEDFVQSLQSRYQMIDVIILSEYGIIPVQQHIDILSMIERSSLKPEIDFHFFLEPNMARFWFYHRHAESLISKSLRRLKGGKKLGINALNNNLIAGCDPRNGGLFYLADAGHLIFPNFINPRKPAPLGMINSDKDTPSEDHGTLLLQTGERSLFIETDDIPPDASTVHRLLLELLNLNSGD